ncbi:MAG TPA: hypothetical protein PKK06_02685 [Phycisphaerae bacterium]|nr:hypothetical protein [Phycisphaerae bacterium]HNU44592.1 hypothetical protein [Phycisphaerae bacterium]
MDSGFRWGRRHWAAIGVQGRRVTLLTAALAGGTLAATGCRSSGPPRPPQPWPAVNAAVPDFLPLHGHYVRGDDAGVASPDEPVAGADTRVVARCRGSDSFWQKIRGDWEYTWVVARFDVESVERGSWPDPTLSFICWEIWPTLESGITVSKPPWPYWKDARFAFELDKTQEPPLIVGQKTMYDPRNCPATQPTP